MDRQRRRPTRPINVQFKTRPVGPIASGSSLGVATNAPATNMPLPFNVAVYDAT
jgi:hypothetical protein